MNRETSEQVRGLTHGLWRRLEDHRDLYHLELSELLALVSCLIYLREFATESERIPKELPGLDLSYLSNLLSARDLQGALRELEHRDDAPAVSVQPNVGSPTVSRLALVASVLRGSGTEGEHRRQLLFELMWELERYQRHQLRDLLEELVAVFAARSSSLEFYTPPAVAELIVQLADPRPGERIYDPCLGMGGLLVAATRHVAGAAPTGGDWADSRRSAIVGWELMTHPFVIAMTRLALWGHVDPRMGLGDALSPDQPGMWSNERFDCVLTVPPWGIHHPASDRLPVLRQRSELLFIEHVMSRLAPGGRAVVAVPDGVLFQTGPARRVRQELLTSFRLDGVVSLPKGALAPYTRINSSLLVFRNEEPASKVRFLVVRDFPKIEKNAAPNFGQRTVREVVEIADRFHSGADTPDSWWSSTVALEERDWELLPKPDENPLDKLRQETSSLDWRVLHEVAQVFLGPARGTSLLDLGPDESNGSQLVRLIRVSDIDHKNGLVKVRSRSAALTADVRLPAAKRLQLNDVLLSMSGTVGKIAAVEEGAIGAVATANIAVIRCNAGLKPAFLLSLLRSETYQSWMRVQARGSVVQHLSLTALRRLPVPMVNEDDLAFLDVSEARASALNVDRFVKSYWDYREDVTRIRNKWDLDWLATAPIVLRISKEAAEDRGDSLVLLEQFADAVHGRWELLRDEPQPQYSRSMAGEDYKWWYWVDDTYDAVRSLRDVTDVPPGPARYALLMDVYSRIELLTFAEEYRYVDQGYPPLGFERLSEAKTLLRREIERLSSQTELAARLEPDGVAAGQPAEIAVIVRNESSLPLRNVRVVAAQFSVGTEMKYFGEQEQASFTLLIPPQAAPGLLELSLSWNADRLDGDAVEGVLPLALQVRTSAEPVRDGDLGASPYIVGSPVDRPEMFFGRDQIVEEIKHQLGTRHRANVILLEGNRRVGKTSILEQLRAPEMLPNWLTVNSSFQGGMGDSLRPGLPTAEVFKLMARKIGWAAADARIEVWIPGQPRPAKASLFKADFVHALDLAFRDERSAVEVFELYLQAVIQAIKPRRLLLMLDEFDKIQEGIDSGVTSPIVPENIRYLIHTYPELTVILSGSRRLKRLRESYWSALFGIGHRIEVGPLPREDARLLVAQPVAGRLEFTAPARELIVELCSCQPYLIQSLCNGLFEVAARIGERVITEAAVRKAADELVRDNEHLHSLWDYAKSDRRRLIFYLTIRLQSGPDPATLSTLEARLEELGVEMSEEELEEDLGFLRELDLLELRQTERGHVYQVVMPLMARWTEQHVDFDELVRKANREIGG